MKDINTKKRNTKRKEIHFKVKNRLIDNLNIPFTFEEIHPDTPFFGTGIGLDSIDALEIVVFLEKEFKCSIKNTDLAAMRNLNSIADHVMHQSV